MTLHFAFFEPDTDREELFKQEAWQKTHIVKETNYPGSLFLTVEFTTDEPLDADGIEDFKVMPDYATGMFNVGIEVE